MTYVDEFELLNSFALRFDGYRWCAENGKDEGELLNAYWTPETFDALLAQPVEYQMAVMYLQQRHRYRQERPDGDGLQLWRRLFLSLANVEVPEGFKNEYGDGLGPYKASLPQIEAAMRDRLEHDVPLRAALEIDEPPA
jgi:hypothetical protein